MEAKDVSRILRAYLRFPPPKSDWIKFPKDEILIRKMERLLSNRGFFIPQSYLELNFFHAYCLMSVKPILASSKLKSKFPPTVVRTLRAIVGKDKEREVLTEIGLLRNGILQDEFFAMLFRDDMELINFMHGYGLAYGCTTLLPPRMVAADDLLYEFKHGTDAYHDIFCKTAMLIVAYPFSSGLFDARNGERMVSFLRKRLLAGGVTVLADVYYDNDSKIRLAVDYKSLREAFVDSPLVKGLGLDEDSPVLHFIKNSLTLCVSDEVTPLADCSWIKDEFLFDQLGDYDE